MHKTVSSMATLQREGMYIILQALHPEPFPSFAILHKTFRVYYYLFQNTLHLKFEGFNMYSLLPSSAITWARTKFKFSTQLFLKTYVLISTKSSQ